MHVVYRELSAATLIPHILLLHIDVSGGTVGRMLTRPEITRNICTSLYPADQLHIALRHANGVAEREYRMHPLSVPIGIEIEVPDLVFGKDDAKHLAYREKAEQTIALGIPKGNDPAWEFSFRPAWHYQTLVREVGALVAGSFLEERHTPATQNAYPLHVTVGDIASTDDTVLLGRVLDLTGGSSSERLRQQQWILSNNLPGVRERKDSTNSGILEFQSRTATEFRSLEFKTIRSLSRTLHIAQYLGSALFAHQQISKDRRHQNPRVTASSAAVNGSLDALADIWKSFRDTARSIVNSDLGLPTPRRNDQQWDALMRRNYAEVLYEQECATEFQEHSQVVTVLARLGKIALDHSANSRSILGYAASRHATSPLPVRYTVNA